MRQNKVSLTFFGHAAFQLETEEFRILIDPFISQNPVCPVKLEDIKKVDYIFITHGHGDHVGDAVEIAKKYNSTVVATFELSTYLSKRFDISTHPMHIGGRFEFPFGVVKMTPALHGSGIVEEDGNIIYGGNPCGFVISINGQKIYHAGDTGLTTDMKLLADEGIDVALLPIGGNYVMDIEDAIFAAKFVSPRKVIPMHYNTWEIIKADAEQFKKRLDEINIECILLNPGETIEL